MKKVLLFLMLLVPVFAFSQSKEAKVKLEEYQTNGVYKVDNGNLIVTVVLEDVQGTKDELYTKVRNYYARIYRNLNSVLQVDDKEAGVLVIKGLFSDYWMYNKFITSGTYSAYHTARVDIKNNRLRVIYSASEWFAEWDKKADGKRSSAYSKQEGLIGDYVPLGKKSFYSDKNKTADGFIALIDYMHASIDNLEQSLVGGSSFADENDDW